mmetsp:Transcript_102932/g.193659  ORF Transcript_102932/g.193659 Transcript_102932/m.193659 type:complete len:266 (+) Transcript_102932:2602-3399(+)
MLWLCSVRLRARIGHLCQLHRSPLRPSTASLHRGIVSQAGSGQTLAPAVTEGARRLGNQGALDRRVWIGTRTRSGQVEIPNGGSRQRRDRKVAGARLRDRTGRVGTTIQRRGMASSGLRKALQNRTLIGKTSRPPGNHHGPRRCVGEETKARNISPGGWQRQRRLRRTTELQPRPALCQLLQIASQHRPLRHRRELQRLSRCLVMVAVSPRQAITMLRRPERLERRRLRQPQPGRTRCGRVRIKDRGKRWPGTSLQSTCQRSRGV